MESPTNGTKCNRLLNLAAQIRSKMTDSEWNEFASETTDVGRLKRLQGNEDIEACAFRLNNIYPSNKDRLVAQELKEDGNLAFGQEDYQKSFNLYTQALVWMPHDETKDASVLYANRSAALLHLQEFELTQQDAELGFSHNYPPPLHHKLYERVAKSWEKLGDFDKAQSWILKAIKSLEVSGLTDTNLKRLNKSYESFEISCRTAGKLIGGSRAGVGASPKDKLPKETSQLPKITGGAGKYLKNASKRLSLQYEENRGRFVVANEKLVPGDVILVEKPYVSALLPEFYHRQCSNCFIGLAAPIPCQSCIYASFCSKKCRDEAWESHHRYECGILGVLKHSGISPSCYMALRMLTQSNPKEVAGWFNLAISTEEEPNRLADCGDVHCATESEVSNSNKSKKHKNRKKNRGLGDKNKEHAGSLKIQNHTEVYKTDHEAILHLCTHPTLRQPEDHFIQVVGALYLLEVLKSTSYFIKFESTVKDEDSNSKSTEIKFALILLRCLQSLPYNAHAFDWEPTDNTVSTAKVKYACGLFPTLSLFNHSCYPSIARYMVKDTVVVRVIRNLLPGEEVTENYGQHFMTSPKEIRQAYLQTNYRFDCGCPPCRDSWPGFETLSKELILSYRCEHCTGFVCKSDSAQLLSQCPNCRKALHIVESLELTMEKHEEAVNLFNQGDVENGLDVLLKNISMLDTFLIAPVNDLHVYQEHARIFFCNFGNRISQLPAWDPIECLNKDECLD